MKKAYTKGFGLKDFGAELTAEMLGKINSFALRELAAVEVYARKFLMAHNAIDRDNERFPEALLEDFARTLPGKGFLIGHSRPGPGTGLFFDAGTEEIQPEKFKALTGEEARLPEEVKSVKVLWGWMYTLAANEELTRNIDAGIYRHASIGFRAADLAAVKDEVNGSVKYWEYVPPGEATEGSLVWLGAQPGATAQKLFDDKSSDKEGKENMEFLKRLSKALGKAFGTEDEVIEHIQSLKADMSAGEKRVKELEPLEAKVKELSPLAEKAKELEGEVEKLRPLAEEGKAYRESLVDAFVKAKAKLGEVGETEEAQKSVRAVAEGFDIGYLKAEVGHLEKRVAEKFPEEGQLRSGDLDKAKDKSGAKDKKNPLVPDDGKEG